LEETGIYPNLSNKVRQWEFMCIFYLHIGLSA
jgi:hypothetical protein